MARLESDRGRLLVSFQFRGQRCREYLGLTDTRDNQRAAAKIIRELEVEIASGKFDYEARFPDSRNLDRLSLRSTPVPGRTPFSEFALKWLEELRPTVARSTAYSYERLLKAYILPSSFAAKAVDEIDDGDIKRFIAELQAKELGPRSINIVTSRLRTIFSTARIRKLRSDNPMDYVRNLREKKPEIDPLTLEEVQALLRAAQGSERTLVTVLIFAGLRPGEALGLRWDDIDFREGFIKVRRHVNRFGVGLPKTSSSERDVTMLPPVREALQEQRARSQLRSDLVFVNEGGKRAFDLDNIRQRNWIRLLRRAGLRHRPLYQCRHTYATLLLSAGEDMRFVASQMGHTTLAMLIRHYARWSRRSPAGGNAISKVLEASGLQKMPEFCQKVVSGGDGPIGRDSEKSLDFPRRFTGAGDRFRTDDLVLGKHTLYQLSYTRSPFIEGRTRSFTGRRAPCQSNQIAARLAEVATTRVPSARSTLR